MLGEMELNRGTYVGGPTMVPPDNSPKLSDLGLTKNQSSRWQAIAGIPEGEHDENELRKDFTPSERVAIGKTVKEILGERRGRPSEKCENFHEYSGQRTDRIAAEKAGFGNERTFRDAEKVVDSGSPELVDAMDAGGASPCNPVKGRD